MDVVVGLKIEARSCALATKTKIIYDYMYVNKLNIYR